MTVLSTNIPVGYGGGAKIARTGSADINLFLTGGSITKSLNRPMISFFNLPPVDSDNDYTKLQRSQVIAGYGTTSYSGSISFELAVETMDIISNEFFKRGNTFDLSISDGNKSYTIKKCIWNSFALNVSPRAVVGCSIGWVSNNDRTKNFGDSEHGFEPVNITDQTLIKYWNVGNTGVESFTMNITQEVTPVFINDDTDLDSNTLDTSTPAYFRCGFVNVDLSVVSWDDWISYKILNVGTKKITINNVASSEMSFSHGGQSDVGSHTWTGKGVNLKKAGDELFKIENI